MKKLISILLSITIILSFSLPIFATGGSGNIDGGGGSIGGSGNNHSYWNGSDEGVRVTVVDAQTHIPVSTPIDFTNLNISTNSTISSRTIYHFGKTSKINYNNGKSLKPQQGNYYSYTVEHRIPTIISTGSGTNNIEAIKKYFCSEYIIKRIAEITAMDYDILISGKFKILLEPLAYFKFMGVNIAATATEAALYDQVVNGQLRAWMKSLTHKNLPLAMFLEVGDLGYPAWDGSKTDFATNADILSSLGLGIVRFEEDPEPPIITTYDYEYRTNTEVISSVFVSGGKSDPDNPVNVTFNILGVDYNVGNIYYPEYDGQLAWVKWTTPSEPQDIVIQVCADRGVLSQATINVKVVDLLENPPPNPVADDRNDDFDYSEIPQRDKKEHSTWTVWTPTWHSHWVDRGNFDATGAWISNWVDFGQWDFVCNQYYATLHAEMEILSDSYNPTATDSTLKSGYGINQNLTSRVTTNQNSATTRTPNALSYFPEFGYDTYWRLLERIKTGSLAEFEFKPNVYSTYRNRTHFTPLWMPDGPYTVNTWLIDYWTPSRMLSANLSDSLTVKGNLWQDWHIGPIDNN